jgi:hypothetical protein
MPRRAFVSLIDWTCNGMASRPSSFKEKLICLMARDILVRRSIGSVFIW